MYIRFGNLSVKQFALRVGTEFTDEEIELLESHRSAKSTFTDQSKFHIFDDPAITIDIGTVAMAEVGHIFQTAHNRKPFQKTVSLYPVSARRRNE